MLIPASLRQCLLAALGLLVLGSTVLSAENRQALLIANGTYSNFSSLATPVNEAQDLAATLKALGFQVTLLKNASREQMLDALDSFGSALKGKGGTAFFHYGGHGVQVAGKNYLIPVDADIPDERKAATRAVDVDEIMSTLDASGADTSIVCLDACRNNPLPAGAARSASRGLSVVGVKPKNSVIVYAAEAGTTAQDGLFTPALTRALKKPGLSLSDVFTEVRRQVYDLSKGAQTPGEYNQLFSQVYLAGAAPAAASPATAVAIPELTPKIGAITVTPGSLRISVVSAGTLQVAGQQMALPAGANVPLDNLAPGDYPLVISYPDGQSENRTVRIDPGQAATVAFVYKPASAPTSASVPAPSASSARNLPVATSSSGAALVTVPNGTFQMGGPIQNGYSRFGMTEHDVTLSSYAIGAGQVTQALYKKVMGRNPSIQKADKMPVTGLSWYDAVEFCNKLSQVEGLQPAYTITGKIIGWNPRASGYRLPTSAEWEYAARGAPESREGAATPAADQKMPGPLGLFDMVGNMLEWCWDWYGGFDSEESQTDPTGPASGTERQTRARQIWESENASAESMTTGISALRPTYNEPSAPTGFRIARNASDKPGASAPPSTQAAAPANSGQNSVGMTMVPIAGGNFRLGMTEKEAQAMWPEWKTLGWFKTGSKELAPHQVSVRSFLMSTTEVTREQYNAVFSVNDHSARGNTTPAAGMTRLDALLFCNSLSNREGLQPVYVFADKFKSYTCDFNANGYRLPTEAEWEYAARGSASQTVPYAGSANVDEVAWHSGNARGAVHPVAQKKPNGYGLYDMAGNLWEMVWDWYGAYPTTSQTDPAGSNTGPGRVIRGGSWFTDATTARSSLRMFTDRDVGMSSVGFRVVLPQR